MVPFSACWTASVVYVDSCWLHVLQESYHLIAVVVLTLLMMISLLLVPAVSSGSWKFLVSFERSHLAVVVALAAQLDLSSSYVLSVLF